MLEEKRERISVTQGSVTAYTNGQEIATFADDIHMIADGDEYYGDLNLRVSLVQYLLRAS